MVWSSGLTRRLLPSLRRRLVHNAQSARAISTKFDVQPRQLSASGQPMRVVFGAKAAADHLGNAARAAGIHKMLVVRDRDAGAASRTQYVEFLLMQAGIPCFQFTLPRDCATVESVELGLETAVRVGADGVLAFGGGSTADMARSIALLLSNDYSFQELMEGDNESLELDPPVPHLIMPTIAGAGGEVSTQALVLDEDADTKFSLVTTPILPEAVIVDPLLSLSVPLVPTVQGALTALGQCMESYLLGCEDPATEALALQGIEVVAAALATPLVEGKIDLKSVVMREKLALASVLSGFAANSSGCGSAHAIAVAMGGISDLPHAQIASAFLPFVFDRYAQLAEDNAGDEFFDELKEKLECTADRLTAASGFQSASVSAWLRYVSTRFDLPTPATLELDESMLRGIVDCAALRQDATMDLRSDENGAILEKDDLRAVLDSAVMLMPPIPKSDDQGASM